MPNEPQELLRAALHYAAAGIAVVPLHTPEGRDRCSCGAEACPSPGKHPRLRHGIREATTDPNLIHRWWQSWPAANIGVATGAVLDVCDVDTSEGLQRVLAVCDVAAHDAPLVRTGQGWHLWFAASDLPSRIGFVPGVDWRGRGGSAVAPPSLHSAGPHYRFLRPWTATLPLPESPAHLRELVLPTPVRDVPVRGQFGDVTRYMQAALDGEVARIRSAPRPVLRRGLRISPGGRNDALVRAAFRLGQLASEGTIDRTAIWARLTEAAMEVGLTAAEAQRTIASGWRAGTSRPRYRGAIRRSA